MDRFKDKWGLKGACLVLNTAAANLEDQKWLADLISEISADLEEGLRELPPNMEA